MNKQVKPTVKKIHAKPRKSYNTNFQQKVTSFRINNIDCLHYLNVKYLNSCLTHLNSIVDRKITNHNNRYQRRLSKAIKIARFLGLVAYTM